MATTNITITQDNIIGDVDLMSAHNVLVFIALAEHDGTPPDELTVEVYYNGSEFDTYSAIYLEDVTPTERKFMFIADEAIRKRLDKITDIDQSVNQVISMSNLTHEMDINFSVYLEASELVTIIAANVARDFEDENGPTLVDLYNNESLYYVGAIDQNIYLYWWNDDENNIIGGDQGIALGADICEALENTYDTVLANYPDYMAGGDGIKDIWVYFLCGPNQIVFEASAGAVIDFSNINLGASLSYTLGNNNTVDARLIVTFDSNPANGELFEFRFTTDLTPMPVEGYVDVLEYFGTNGGITLDVGFIRKKINTATKGEITECLNIEGVDYCHTVNVRDYCEGDITLKYLDNNGQYRYMFFSKHKTRNSNPQSIGDINELVLSLKDDPGNKSRIGYNNNNNISLSASQLNETERALLDDFYNSQQVYLITASKEILVTVAGNNISEFAKAKFNDLNIVITLPTSYNITQL